MGQPVCGKCIGGEGMVVYICDDEEVYVDKILLLIKEYNQVNQTKIITKDFTDEDEMMEEIRKCRDADLIFMDIELSKENGVYVADNIKNMMESASVAYITSHRDKYHDVIFCTEPIGYLIKPPDKNEVFRVIDMKRRRMKVLEQVELQVVCNHKKVSIPIERILHINSNRRTINICTTGGEYIIYEKLDDIESKIKELDKNFIRIHKSTLINLRYMKKYANDRILMSDDKEFSISKSYRGDVCNRYLEYIREKTSYMRKLV